MAAYRNNLGCRISGDAKESLARLCKFTERSQAKLIELVLCSEERRLMQRLNDDERDKYLTGQTTLVATVLQSLHL